MRLSKQNLFIVKSLLVADWRVVSNVARFTFFVRVSVLFFTVCIGVTTAGIPAPPVVLYGQLVLDGQTVQATDNVNIVARVAGIAEPIGIYPMGQIPAAGNNYVLMLRLESLFGGLPPSNNAAQQGQSVDLFVKVANGPERPAGQVQNLGNIPTAQNDLSVMTAFGQCADEAVGIGMADAATFINCLTGVNGHVTLDCGCADFDKDSDSDMADWAKMQIAFTGAP